LKVFEGKGPLSFISGLVRTNIFNGSSKLVSAMILISSFILGKNGLQGAQTTIHLAMMGKKSFNGKYFADCREG